MNWPVQAKVTVAADEELSAAAGGLTEGFD
jgi:hypothetical protein